MGQNRGGGRGRVTSQVEEGLADANAREHTEGGVEERVAIPALHAGHIGFVPGEMPATGHPTHLGILKRTP